MIKHSFLFFSFLICFCSCTKELQDSSAAAKYTRADATTSLDAENILNLYAYGLAITKSYDCTDPASWYYQGSMHSVPTPDEMGSGIDSLCAAHNTGETFRAWNSCPHMKPTEMQLNFLTWHRLYIYYNERNIRHQIANGGGGYEGLGDEVAAKFSLPYWDYTNQPYLPEAFRGKDYAYSFVDISGENPLYESGRSKTLLAGEPIDFEALDSVGINVDGAFKRVCLNSMRQALDYDKLLALDDVSEFSRALEDRMHNIVHNYVGGKVESLDTMASTYNRIYQTAKKGYGLMAEVPTAGFDPIFFLHHANIDRMFAAWEAIHGPITIDDMNSYGGKWDEIKDMYQFWDSPTNSWITYNSMQEMLDAAHNIDYDYQFLPELANMESDDLDDLSKAHVYTFEQEDLILLDSIGDAFEIDLSGITELEDEDNEYKLEIDLAFGANIYQHLLVFTVPPNHDWSICDLDLDYVHSVSSFFGSTHAMHAHHHGHGAKGQEFRHQLLIDITKAVQSLPEDETILDVYIAPMHIKDGPDFYVKQVSLYEYK